MLPTKEWVYASVRQGLFPELNEAGISQRNRNVSFKPNALGPVARSMVSVNQRLIP